MIRASLLVLILSAYRSVHAADDEECTIKSESAVQCVADMVKKIEPIKVQSIPPTKWCSVKGVSGLKQTPDKEVNTVKNDPVTNSDFFVEFERLNIECLLELDENPAMIPSIIQKSMTDAAKNNCPPDRQGEAMAGMKNGAIPQMKLEDMLKLTECLPDGIPIPKAPSIGGGGGISIGRRKRSVVEGKMYIDWANVKVTFQTLVTKGSTKVRINKVAVVSNDYDNIHVKCVGPAKFDKSCQCVRATKFPVNLVTSAVYLILPCTVDEEAQKYDDIVQYFDCRQ